MLLNAAMAHTKKQNDGSGVISGAKSAQDMSHEDMLSEIAENQDKKCFALLFEHYAPRVKSFLMKAGCSAEQADELAQETMLTIWHKAKSYNPEKAKASTWIFTIARNKKIDTFRKNKRQSYEIEDNAFIEDEADLPNEKLIQLQETEILAKAIQDLPEEQSELIKKSFFEDKSHAEIAEETGIALGTIKSRIRLALQKLRKENEVKVLWQ